MVVGQLKESKLKYIGIVVDHPSRDLPALSILAEEFVKKKRHVALIPSNKIDHVLLNENKKFELIIFNFYRLENYKKIIYAKSKNIKVAILDQEAIGGVNGEAQKNIFLNPILKKHLNKIDFFFFTSNYLKKICLNSSEILPKNNVVCGYHKFDIVKKKYNNVKIQNFILISTNFPATNPLFVKSKNKIIEDTVKFSNNNTNLKDMKDVIEKKFKLQNKFFLEIEKILQNYPKLKFILRPHPFEKSKFWKPLESNYKNCKVTNEFNSLEWINKCKFLIHLDCSTSCEASMLNKPSISLKYLFKDIETLTFRVAHECSIACNNFNEVKAYLDQALFKKKINPRFSSKLKNFFFNPEILSSKYIVDIICKDKSKIIFKNQNSIKLDYISYIKNFIENCLGKNVHDFILFLFRGREVMHSRKLKFFSENDIYKYIDKKIKIIKSKYFYLLSI